MFKISLLYGVFFCALSVILGAFGAHALKDRLGEYASTYDKAVLYQMFHSLAILFIALLGYYLNTDNFNIVIWMFVLGILLFSGSLFVLSISGIKWLGAITPIGGTLFIIGWLLAFLKILKLKL